MLEQEPVARARTNPTPGSHVDLVVARRKVTYVFDTSASNPTGAITMAVAVHVNGKSVPFELKPGDHPFIRSVSLFAEAGAKIELFLNGDAAYQSQPVYAVQVGANDVRVLIKEKTGKHPDEAVLGGPTTSSDGRTDEYTASLTGDIWLQVSHRYTENEVGTIIPPDTKSAIRAAVLLVYRGLQKSSLNVDFPATDSAPASSVRIDFKEQENPGANIRDFSLLRDGLPRLHPYGYLALLEAAHESGVTRLEVDSGWRPMLGSIAHRDGRGIDVIAISAAGRHTWLQRIGLRRKSLLAQEDITPAEKAAYDELVQTVARYQASRRLAEQRAHDKSLLNASPSERDRAIEEANNSRDDALRAQHEAEEKWRAAIPGSEPQPVKLFRGALLTHRFVKQLLDPWYMDLDTKDRKAPVPNAQSDGLSKLHSTHLHLTITR